MSGPSIGTRDGVAARVSRVTVRVEDAIDATLTGRAGRVYESPPQTREQAMALVRLLLGHAGDPVEGEMKWVTAIVGGRRTVSLEPEQAG